MMVLMERAENIRQLRREGPLSDLLNSRTYLVSLYILLALPTSALAFALLLGGVVGGVVSLPILVGAPILLLTLWLVGALAEAQRVLAGLLGIDFARPALPPSYTGVLPWLRSTLSDAATYRALLFHVAQLPLILLCWAVLLVLGGVAVVGLGSPLWLLDPVTFHVVWRDTTLQPSAAAVAGMLLLGLGSLLVTGGVVNLMGRVWVRLCTALLARDLSSDAARREVIALRQAAGRVALGDDLKATLLSLTGQAKTASTARTIALVASNGGVEAHSGPDDLSGVLDDLPAPGEASVRAAPDGGVLAALPVTLPASAEMQGGTLRAEYAPGIRPSADELAFLLSIADHAGTALHAAQLIERAGARAGEQERARLARELHDSVAQALYGISLGAKTARATLEKDTERAKASLDYTIRLADGGVSEMKALLFSLRPDALEEGGLVAALTQHAHALEARHGLSVHADLADEPPLTSEQQSALYRVAQEALHNVVKHARASEVWLSLLTAGRQVTLTVRDNGRGFDPQAQGRGTLGQRSMRERAAGIGAQLSVLSAADAGTTVTLTLPLGAPAQPQPQPQLQEVSA